VLFAEDGRVVVRFLPVLILSIAAAAADLPKVFYSKSFPGSTPPYVSIELQADGTAVYKEAPDDEDPVAFRIPEQDAKEIFNLVEKMDHFKRPLEAGLKVAKMGEKTFRYINGSEKSEQVFNYSLDESARALQEWFEKMTESQQLWILLERSVKFDRLGVNNALLRLEAAYDRNRVVAPDRFLPLLDRVVKNDGYMNMARERAAALAAAFRDPKPPKPPAE
jgi:hypothetical protein